MRGIDRRECEAFGRDPKTALRIGLKASALCWTGKKDDRPGAMFGAVARNEIESIGTAWFLGTDEVFGCARELLSMGPAVIEAMHRRFRRLENMVSTENKAAIRLLEAWGFELGSDTVDVNGVEFRCFWREAPSV
ncbi:hypothetical protein [Sphingomonas sp. URHD0057]|uniref:hypothetical protein n=1 Tax=Sphingomonas sp. URHD0057 TaxID=1380389 RepID=UPI001E57CF5A|nr:hypothetical protein [Sphingomonas sp. URHD0057]